MLSFIFNLYAYILGAQIIYHINNFLGNFDSIYFLKGSFNSAINKLFGRIFL